MSCEFTRRLTPNAILSATKGLGRTQPADWQDAGDSLEHDDLKGCWMPKGTSIFWLFEIHANSYLAGGLTDTQTGAGLQYNEVSYSILCGHRTQTNEFLYSISYTRPPRLNYATC